MENGADIGIKISMLLLLIVLFVEVVSCIEKLSQIKTVLQHQFDYQVEMQLCLQDAKEYPTQCHLEMEATGEYHWYYYPNEGRYYE